MARIIITIEDVDTAEEFGVHTSFESNSNTIEHTNDPDRLSVAEKVGISVYTGMVEKLEIARRLTGALSEEASILDEALNAPLV